MPAEPGCLFPWRGEAQRANWELCGVGVIGEGRASLKVAEVSCALGGPNMAVSMGVSLGTGESPESRIIQSSAWGICLAAGILRAN